MLMLNVYLQVHKEKVDKIPNSVPGRNSCEVEIYGTEGIPDNDIKEHERQKSGKGCSYGSLLNYVFSK